MTDLKRRYELTLTMGADDLPSLRGMLMTLLYDMDRINETDIERNNPYQAISGGYSGNHSLKIEFRPDVTHDSYIAELEAYLAARKEGDDGGE